LLESSLFCDGCLLALKVAWWRTAGASESSPYPSKRRSGKIAHRRLSTGPTLTQGCWGLGMNSKRLAGDRRAIIAGVAGNVMEWYDFSVYGYFATNIGRHFFPTQDAVSSLIAAFGVFAAGFLMRPLGSLVFGHIGDKMGRKTALTASVALMAIPTFLIGALPTYQQIGVTASVFLVLMRLLQGLSVGGEYTTSSIFLVERSAAGHRGIFGSFAEVGACSGILLGSALSGLVTTVLDRAMVDSWGWRIPFLIGVTVGITGLYIRRHVIEETGPQRHQPGAASPIREAFTEWRTILRLIGLGAVGAVGFYMSFVYITTYLRQVDHTAQSTALDINTIAMAVLLLLLAPVGALSDRFGRKPVLLIATGGMFLMAWPLFWMLHHNSPLVILFGQIGFAVLSACFWGTIPSTMVELVPARVRCTVLSVGYNTGMAILGGLTPMVAVYTIKRSQYDLSPAFLLMAAAAISFVVVIALRETYKMWLPGTAAVPAEAA
jgi:MHS family proline/betaine transporter-like MFS transporter